MRQKSLPDANPTSLDLKAVLAQYRAPNATTGVRQLLNSLLPFGLLWFLMWYSLQYSYAVTLLLAIPTAGFLVRLYILQHDCGHGSLFKSKWLNDWIGRVLAVMVFTPYLAWKSQHAQHHASAGDLERRGVGDVHTLTLAEFQRLPRMQRFGYRIYRHPLFVFGLAPLLYFVVIQRFTSGLPKSWKNERASVHLTNLAIAVCIAGMCWLIGWKAFLMVHAPIIAIASSLGMWLFYVQHNFEGTYWEHHGEWDFETAALRGSSFYDLPAPLQWITANIGFHHIHHLDSRIPNYRLQECFDAHPELQQGPRLTLWQSLACVRVKLWDEETRKMVGFPKWSMANPPDSSNSRG